MLLKHAVTKIFGELDEGAARRRLADASRSNARERRVLLIDSPGSAQTYFWIGNVGVDRRYAGRAALDLVNTLYGGRFTSILNTELRIKSGLSYGARSGFTRGTVAGEFAIRSFAQTENTGKALDLALRDADAAEAGGRHSRDAGVGARLRAGPVPAGLRDCGGLGGGAGRHRAVSARARTTSMTIRPALREVSCSRTRAR